MKVALRRKPSRPEAMSAIGPKQTNLFAALPPKADMCGVILNFVVAAAAVATPL